MNKNPIDGSPVQALIDGLQTLTLQDVSSDAMPTIEANELARSMQFILAASAARVRVEQSRPKRRLTTGLKKAAAVSIQELRLLLSARSSAPTQLASSFDDESSEAVALKALVDELERSGPTRD